MNTNLNDLAFKNERLIKPRIRRSIYRSFHMPQKYPRGYMQEAKKLKIEPLSRCSFSTSSLSLLPDLAEKPTKPEARY